MYKVRNNRICTAAVQNYCFLGNPFVSMHVGVQYMSIDSVRKYFPFRYKTRNLQDISAIDKESYLNFVEHFHLTQKHTPDLHQ